MRQRIMVVIGIILSILTVTLETYASDWNAYKSTYVVTNTNQAGQTVYTVCENTNGTVKEKLQILARGGNVYNSNTKTILTKESLGPNYVAIDSSLNTYVITRDRRVVKYSKGFRSGSTPSVLSYTGASSFEKNYENGFLSKICVQNGFYDIKTSKLTTIVAGKQNSYPRVEKVENSYYFYINPSTYYTYKWSGGTSELSIDGKRVVSNVNKIAFSPNFVLYVNNKNEVYRCQIGTTYTKLMTSNFSKFNYDTSKWVTNVVDSKYAYPVNADSKDLYPKVKRSGNKYYYYTSDTKYYMYRLSNDGELTYRGTKNSSKNEEIATNVDKVKFAEGYLVYLTEDDYVYKVEIGTTYSRGICNKFERFIYDGDLVRAVEDNVGIYEINK